MFQLYTFQPLAQFKKSGHDQLGFTPKKGEDQLSRAVRHRWPDAMPVECDQNENDPPTKLAITIEVKAFNLIHDATDHTSSKGGIPRVGALECTADCDRGSDLTCIPSGHGIAMITWVRHNCGKPKR